jgi:hypothetical protein
MVRYRPWPFPSGAFPDDLGAVVQLTVLNGSRPGLVVEHFEDGSWAIGDGLDDPNQAGASVATHIWHAIERNSSIAGLASLPPGYGARRRSPAEPWTTYEIEPGD